MSDKNDKTVFKQPSVNSDRTIIRPSPGRRSVSARSPGMSQPVNPSPQPAVPASGTNFRPDIQSQVGADDGSYFKTSLGLNPLVNAASTLIAVFEKTRSSLSHPDVGGLHQRLVGEVKLFENKAKEIGIQPEIILSARYCICAALDEAVLNTPWGSESAWAQRTLLSVFHNETSGGEKYFLVLERMLEQPAENLYILELLYIFLSLGFEGKYRVIHRGREKIEQLRDEVFSTIRRQRGEYERSLSPHWQGLGKSRKSLTNYLPIWVVASILGAVLLISYSGFRVWLFESSSPVVEKLDEITVMRTVARPTSDK
jgi:type VI secretion system protein ImpK